MANSTIKMGTSQGPELLIRLRGGRRRAQLEDRLRELVRDGTLSAGGRLPSTRALAADLEVSRRLVVDAYAQLLAEGYLISRQGGGTYVAAGAAPVDGAEPQERVRALQFDFFPGAPDLASFPRALWSRALRDVLRAAPASAFAYPDGRGASELRSQLAGLPATRARRGGRSGRDRGVRGRHPGARAAGAGARPSRHDARSPWRTRAFRRIARCSPTRASTFAACPSMRTASMSTRVDAPVGARHTRPPVPDRRRALP